MHQDAQFASDVQELIQTKQKQSAFVYVRNHLALIEQALHEGAKIADIYTLLQKHSINITLSTLRLYLHRLRNLQKTPMSATTETNQTQTESKDKTQFNNNIASLQEVHFIKQQTPNLEELSKAFTQRKP